MQAGDQDRCDKLADLVSQIRAEVDQLPSSVDRDTRRSLDDGVSRLEDSSREECEQTETTETETTPTETETVPTETVPPPTDTTTVPTTPEPPTVPTTPDGSDGGGADAPEEGQ